MATWADVERILGAIPEAQRTSARQWKVKGSLAVWERPLRDADLEALGDAAPKGDVLGVYAPLEVKDALVQRGGAFFTTPHFDGWPAVLVALKQVRAPALREVLISACASRGERAPRKKARRR